MVNMTLVYTFCNQRSLLSRGAWLQKARMQSPQYSPTAVSVSNTSPGDHKAKCTWEFWISCATSGRNSALYFWITMLMASPTACRYGCRGRGSSVLVAMIKYLDCIDVTLHNLCWEACIAELTNSISLWFCQRCGHIGVQRWEWILCMANAKVWWELVLSPLLLSAIRDQTVRQWIALNKHNVWKSRYTGSGHKVISNPK